MLVKHTARGEAPVNALCREGDTWLVDYEGEAVRLRDAKGVRDLAALLARPGVEIHAADLVIAAERLPDVDMSVATVPAGAPADGNVTATRREVARATVDSRARREYRARVADLRDEIVDADRYGNSERSGRLRRELAAVSAELARSYGLAGRPRSVADSAERMRKAVAARIHYAIERLRRLHPTLAAHLQAAVRTGTFCVYLPSQPTRWEISEYGANATSSAPRRTPGSAARSSPGTPRTAETPPRTASTTASARRRPGPRGRAWAAPRCGRGSRRRGCCAGCRPRPDWWVRRPSSRPARSWRHP